MKRIRRCALPLLVVLFCSGCSFSPIDRIFGAFRADAEKYFDDARVVSLIETASKGDVEGVRTLVDDGVDIEARSNDHDSKRASITPLLWAVEFESARTVTTLLGGGADPLATTMGGYNAVNYAVLRDKILSMQAILDWDGSLVESPDRFGGNALHGIALHGREDMLDVVVEAGIALDTRQTVSGQTPLFSAAAVNNLDMCLKLLRAGADAGIRDGRGNTFLPSLFRTNDKIMTREFLSKREKVVDELRSRGYPVETGR